MKLLAIVLGVLLLAVTAGAAVLVQQGEFDLANVLGPQEKAAAPVAASQSGETQPSAGGSQTEAKADAANKDAAKDIENDLAALSDLKSGLAKKAEKPDSNKPSFDIARIQPDGISVFAGQGTPYETVSVLADGVLVGTAKVDANGEWVLTTETKFANADPELSLEVGMPPAGSTAVAETEKPAEAGKDAAAVETADAAAAAAAGQGKDEPSQKVRDVNDKMLSDLQQMVDKAEQKSASAEAAGAAAKPEPGPQSSKLAMADQKAVPSDAQDKPATAAAQAAAAREREKERAAAAAGPAASGARQEKSVPIPVQFVFREATFTPAGERAANLLLQYLKAGKLNQVTLSGHADERGTDGLNMELSVQRLKAVEHYLRSGGYTGKLVLVPKGKSEPYNGVDRASFSKEELFQLDRRVELHLDTLAAR